MIILFHLHHHHHHHHTNPTPPSPSCPTAISSPGHDQSDTIIRCHLLDHSTAEQAFQFFKREPGGEESGGGRKLGDGVRTFFLVLPHELVECIFKRCIFEPRRTGRRSVSGILRGGGGGGGGGGRDSRM